MTRRTLDSDNVADLDVIRAALKDQPEALAEFEKHIGNDREAIGFALAANIGPVRLAALPANPAPLIALDDFNNLLRAVDAVIALHDKPTDPDRAMPMCWECGAQKPCPTLRLLSFYVEPARLAYERAKP